MAYPYIAKLRNIIKSEQVGLITLDIFDTVLFHSVEHENINFWNVAQDFAKYFDKKITPEYIYLLRLYSRQYLDSKNKNEPNAMQISSWIVNRISRDYNLTLSEKLIHSLSEIYIELELEVLKSELRLNIDLINFVREIKQKYPHINFYFISDMYLRNDDIVELLNYFGVESLFKGGYVSSEKKKGKYTGRAFIELINKYPDIKKHFPYNQLHIGDNYISDYKSPSKLGINSYWLKASNYSNKIKIDRKLSKINKRIDNYYKFYIKKLFSNSFNSDIKSIKTQHRNYIAYIIGLCFIKYIYFLIDYSTNVHKKTYLLSREGSYIKKLISCTNLNHENFVVLTNFNRRNLLRDSFLDKKKKKKI